MMERGGDKERQGQGDGKAIYARHGSSVQATTEQELRLGERKHKEIRNLQWKVLTSEAIKPVKNHANFRAVEKLPGGGKKKGQNRQSQAHQDKSETRSAESDMFFEMIQKGGHKGDDVFQTLMQMDEGTVQEIMSRMKRAVAVEGGAFGIHSSSFEAVERWVREGRQTTRKAARARQEEATQEGRQTSQRDGRNTRRLRDSKRSKGNS